MEIIVKNLADLPDAAARLAPILVSRAGGVDGSGVVAFHGGMGAGKTTLIAALLRAMGSADEVTSPTFALVNDYLVPAPAELDKNSAPAAQKQSFRARAAGVGSTASHIYHFDFYRINDLSEAFDLGYEEYFFGGELCLVEWPERIEPLIPAAALHVEIDLLPDGGRKITLQE